MMLQDFDRSSGRTAAISSPEDSRRALLRDVISARFPRQTEFLAELVKVPSDNPPGNCAPHAERAAQLLESLGFHVERYRVPEDVAHAHGMISATNLVIRHRFGDGPTLALNAHGDVVAPGAGWSHDPYGAELVDGIMYGRGVAVSKSDFATYAFALRALVDSGLRLAGAVELHLTYDEEQGGEIGPGWLLAQNISTPDYAICAGFSYGVVVAHNGCLHLEVEVIGRSAHAAIPATGIDALAAATGILAALYAYRDGLQRNVSASPGIGAPQLTVGLISGGINTNVVPDRVVFRLDRRITPEENPEIVEAEVRAVVTTAANATPAAVTIRRVLLARPLIATAASHRLAEILCRQATAIFGEPVETCGVPLYTDARHYAERGIPVVLYGAGPKTIEEAGGHRADERLKLADLERATLVVASAISDLLA
jgi:succinyl-diaminopimelate desuccinylase